MARKKRKNNNSKNNNSKNNNSSILEKKHKLLETSQRGKLLIKFIILIPPLFYGYLKLHLVDITPFTNDYFSSTILKFSFIIYYLSWVYGTLFDMNLYDISLISSLKNKGVTLKDYAISLVFIMIFSSILCSKTNFYVAISLSLFWLTDWLAYQYLLKYQLNPLLRESENEYKKMNTLWSFLRLESIRNYLFGTWRTKRYLVGIPILLLLISFSFENFLSTSITNYFNLLSTSFIFSLIFLFYILTIESWMWISRLNTKTSIKLISENENKYILSYK